MCRVRDVKFTFYFYIVKSVKFTVKGFRAPPLFTSFGGARRGAAHRPISSLGVVEEGAVHPQADRDRPRRRRRQGGRGGEEERRREGRGELQLRALYAVDALLWAAALSSTCLCYRPPALPAIYMRNLHLHLLSDAELEDVEMRLMSCVW